jgi:hypothetical protein
MTPWCQPFDTFWLFPIGLLLTTIFSASVAILTLLDFVHMHLNPKSPISPLPAVCKLGAIIPAFLLVVCWATSLAVAILLRITSITADLYFYLFGHYRYGEKLLNNKGKSDALVIAQGVGFVAQAGLLLAVGILGAQERRDIKRRAK